MGAELSPCRTTLRSIVTTMTLITRAPPGALRSRKASMPKTIDASLEAPANPRTARPPVDTTRHERERHRDDPPHGQGNQRVDDDVNPIPASTAWLTTWPRVNQTARLRRLPASSTRWSASAGRRRDDELKRTPATKAATNPLPSSTTASVFYRARDARA
jgi:hypothetical protein